MGASLPPLISLSVNIAFPGASLPPLISFSVSVAFPGASLPPLISLSVSVAFPGASLRRRFFFRGLELVDPNSDNLPTLGLDGDRLLEGVLFNHDAGAVSRMDRSPTPGKVFL